MRWPVFLAAITIASASACWRGGSGSKPREAKRDGGDGGGGAQNALSPDAALSRIEQLYRPGVQRCYESHLKRDPAARGRVTVTFTVDPSGRLSYREARGIHPSVEKCVEGAMTKWSFPQPSTETTFRLALQLSSRT